MSNPRILLAGGVVLAALVVGVVVLSAGRSGTDRTTDKSVRTVRAKLTLERAAQPEAGYEELLVSLPNQQLNSSETTGGTTSVFLRCVDKDGRVTIRQQHKWPLVEEYGYSPHIHQPAVVKVLDSLRSCRLTGTGIAFAGRVVGRLPSFQPIQ